MRLNKKNETFFFDKFRDLQFTHTHTYTFTQTQICTLICSQKMFTEFSANSKVVCNYFNFIRKKKNRLAFNGNLNFKEHTHLHKTSTTKTNERDEICKILE